MLEQQRRQFDRIQVARPLEIETTAGAPRVFGYTRNLSEAGLAARVDVPLPVGCMCLLQLTLAEGAPPADTCAEIIWCRKDIYGAGAEVGLRLLASDRAVAVPQKPEPRVRPGAVVQVMHEGIVYEGRVTKECLLRTGDGDTELSLVLGEPVRLHGAVEEEAPVRETDAELLAAAEEWKPRPVLEAWLAVRRYALPIAVVLAAVARPLWRFLRPRIASLWARMPQRHRERAERLWVRLDLLCRLERLWAKARSLAILIYEEVRTRRAALVRRPQRPHAAPRS
ncbi:MAG: PilZ domain-containing protein [Myxococcota bacterium]|jgi:hypothetical protein|nr:PilZ domain-containing protein [Myxococcota bacterium]